MLIHGYIHKRRFLKLSILLIQIKLVKNNLICISTGGE